MSHGAVQLVPISDEGEATARLSQARDRPGGIADQRERALRDVVRGILETFGADDLGDRIERHLPLRKQSQAALDLQDSAHRGIEASHRDAPSLQCGEHREDGRVGIGGHEQEIRSRFERPDRRIARTILGDDAAHHQRIGHNQATEPQRIA